MLLEDHWKFELVWTINGKIEIKQSFFIFKVHLLYLRRFASLKIPVIFRQDFRLFSYRKLCFVIVHRFVITNHSIFYQAFSLFFVLSGKTSCFHYICTNRKPFFKYCIVGHFKISFFQPILDYIHQAKITVSKYAHCFILTTCEVIFRFGLETIALS